MMNDLNIIGLIEGNCFGPNKNPIHIFEQDKDHYEHAEFYKDNDDFYQIVWYPEHSKAYYHFQKIEADRFASKIEGNWWFKFSEFTRSYTDYNKFIMKIIDRINHNYKINKLVIKSGQIGNGIQNSVYYDILVKKGFIT